MENRRGPLLALGAFHWLLGPEQIQKNDSHSPVHMIRECGSTAERYSKELVRLP